MNKNATADLICRGIYVNQMLLCFMLRKLGCKENEVDRLLQRANKQYEECMKEANKTAKKYLDDMEKIYEGMNNG